MSDIVKIENLKKLIIEIRGQSVLLDSDVAQIYEVETKLINEAEKNNPDKFPQDYMLGLSEVEFADLRLKFSTAKFSKTRVVPNAFTEKGFYMLATILRSKQVIEATFAIIETFSKIRFQAFLIWNAVRTELSWTYYRTLLCVENESARNGYMAEATNQNWSRGKDVL